MPEFENRHQKTESSRSTDMPIYPLASLSYYLYPRLSLALALPTLSLTLTLPHPLPLLPPSSTTYPPVHHNDDGWIWRSPPPLPSLPSFPRGGSTVVSGFHERIRRRRLQWMDSVVPLSLRPQASPAADPASATSCGRFASAVVTATPVVTAGGSGSPVPPPPQPPPLRPKILLWRIEQRRVDGSWIWRRGGDFVFSFRWWCCCCDDEYDLEFTVDWFGGEAGWMRSVHRLDLRPPRPPPRLTLKVQV